MVVTPNVVAQRTVARRKLSVRAEREAALVEAARERRLAKAQRAREREAWLASGDARRRAVLQRDLDDALRRRALHVRRGDEVAFRAADLQADRFLALIRRGVAEGRWES